MAQESYYDILGVSKESSAEEVKKAYRKLAQEHHPDKHGGDDARFKKINEAYQTLSDPQKRQAYDQFGAQYDQAGGFGGAGGPGGFGGFDFSGFQGGAGDLNDIFEMFFSGGRGGGGGRRDPGKGNDVQVLVELDFKEAVFGTEKTMTLNLPTKCEHCEGSGAEPGSSLKTCETCHGSGQVEEVRQTILGAMRQASVCKTCDGTGKVPEKACSVCKGDGRVRKAREVKVEIPAGIDNGQQIRVAGEGEAGLRAAAAGDLYVQVRVKADRHLHREGSDIFTEAAVDISTAALGGEVEVESLEGKKKLKVAAGTQSGTVIKLSGQGVPHLRGGRRGDQLVTLHVQTPTKLSGKQKKLLEEFAKEGGRKGLFS
jgi:molecular chaperone DnaJ